MFAVKISDFISSAHYLREYKGKCEKLHGHNWQVEVVVEKESLGSDGMVIDFKILKKYLRAIVDTMDHKVLNDEVDFFKTINPSAENISKYIFEELEKALSQEKCKVAQVSVSETRDCWAIYKREA